MTPPTPHRRRLLAAGLLALLLGWSPAGLPLASPATAFAADASSDIPGIPLPGPVSAGRLGGSIYDVVYRVEVEPGHVIVASLTGAAGTDFDMYLFDETATTVLSTAGLLAKSVGLTSTESISWPTKSGGTFYIDLNGATDLEGDFRLTVQTVPDGTPPLVAVSLAGGKPLTNQLTVAVALSASDDLSGVADMAFSPDGVTYGPWLPFQSTTTWTFPPGDGPKPLWVKVRNGVGLESAPAHDTVSLDTIAPGLIGFDPLPGSSVVGLRPTLKLTFSEPIDPASWHDLGLIMQAANGMLVAGSYTYDDPTRTGSFVPSAALQAGAVYIVTVGDVRDLAGNLVPSPGSWSLIALSATTLETVASPSVVLPGGQSRIAVRLTGAALPAMIELSSSTAGGPFVAQAPIATEDGSNALLVTPGSNTTYRFRYPGAFGVAESRADVRVLVRRSVALANRSPGVIARATVGAPVRLTAAIKPAGPGVSVSFRLYRFVPARRAWVYAGSHGRNTDANGRATYTWTPSAPGQWYWRAAVGSTVAFANNVSPVYRWAVSP